MTLKLIPVERASNNGNGAFCQNNEKRKRSQKNFNPGHQISKKNREKDKSLKNVCFRIIHFINRGSKFTYQQIDDLIMAMEHTVLGLQKKKREIIERKRRLADKKGHG